MRHTRSSLVVAAAAMAAVLAGTGCVTAFRGEPYFPGGSQGCWQKCEAEGMVMASMVYMGEYSSGCVCRVRTTTDETGGAVADAAAAAEVAAVAGAGAAAAGVMTAMQRQPAVE